ncbi:MAG TPA: inositol monophosphatase [bacterium]|nr:inositol monophosphatase [bacterium]
MSGDRVTDRVLKTALDAARTGGRILMDGFGKLSETQIGLKGSGDWITDADHASEEAVIGVIRSAFPDHAIHAEESGRQPSDTESEWIIDPLDGTANFVQGIPWFTVSVACLHRGRIHTGVVHDPVREETFWAQSGRGAFLNGKSIRVSAKTDLSTAILATGFPWRSKSFLADYLESFRTLFSRSAGARRMGSASLDLAYTASGRFDGFWEMRLKPWDIAAGILLVKEAGGVVTDFQGGAGFMETGHVVAGPPSIHEKLVEVTHKTLGNIP